MSEFLNTTQLAADVTHAIDDNLKGPARRNYIDAHTEAKNLIVKFIEDLAAKLDKRFSN
jgi:hypothetical protein